MDSRRQGVSVSIIIPAWNAAKTLSDTLDSLSAQSLGAAEVIVVDDGSTDGTATIAEGHALRPTVHRRPHAGVAAATNAGIRASQARYLAFVDADDLWSPDKLAIQIKLLNSQPDIDAVLGLFDSFVCPRTPPHLRARFVVPAQAQPGWLTGTLCVRSSVFSRLGMFAEDLSNGFAIDWFDRARKAGICFHMIETVLLHRRLHPGSLSARNRQSDAAMLEMARRAIARRRSPGAS